MNTNKDWLDIASAPKDGTEILAWRSDCGQFIASYTTPSAFPLNQKELDETDESDLYQADWFTQWPHAARLEGSEVPTLWQPMPADPCLTCGGQGAVGNILNAEPCPDCTPAPTSHPIPTGATGDAEEWGAAFDAWFIKRGVWPRVNYEEIFAAGWNARPAPAAGDALDAARYRLAVSDCILVLRGDAALGRAEWDSKLDKLAMTKGAK